MFSAAAHNAAALAGEFTRLIHYSHRPECVSRGNSTAPPAALSLTDLVSPRASHHGAFAAYRLAFNAGWAFGPATAGFLASRSYSWLFLGDAFTSCLFGVCRLVRACPAGFELPQWNQAGKPALESIFKNKRFVQILLSSLLIGPIFFQASSTYGIYIRQLGFSSATYGALLSLNGIIVVCLELPLTVFYKALPSTLMHGRRLPAHRIGGSG